MLAGITSMDGKSIHSSAMEAVRDERFIIKKEWLEQKRPTLQERREWRMELQKLTAHQYIRRLRNPLGK